MALFDAPIPGQSLTTEPKNAPFERPPEIVNPEEALMVHLKRLNDVDKMEAVVLAVNTGIDVQTLTQGILRSAVMEGIHSIDVSLIIAPVIHEHIKAAATKAGLDFDEGFDNPDRDVAIQYERDTMRAKKMLKKLKEEEGGPELEELNMMEEKPMEEEAEIKLTDMPPAPMGLMARV